MANRKLLLGDEAIAAGAINAGISGVYAYPGTPSTEITEFIQSNAALMGREVRSRWCVNEKTAMEAALGMSYAGKRAIVCMKHVGLNVAADPFVNSAITGVCGGLVVLVADDPSMHSSQNEQDSRFYGKFAMIPILEPSSQQEAYDMMGEAFSLSESLRLPVLVRMVTRLAHSRAAVTVGGSLRQNVLNPDGDRSHWVLLPAIARRQYASLVEKQSIIAREAASSPFNRIESVESVGKKAAIGIIASGIGYNYFKETAVKAPLLKISQYPVPAGKVRELAAMCSSILVVEDGQPFVEEQVRGILGPEYTVRGRMDGSLPRTGELNPDCVAAALGVASETVFNDIHNLVGRPPALCNGCGHRDMYAALKDIVALYKGARVFGDIGCYTLGALPPFKAIDSCVDMGASITMAKGAADAGLFPAVAVIGDSTFTHSGMTGLLDAVGENSPITIIISDNLTTGMTGGQDSAGTGRLEQICLGIGVDKDHLKVVVPLPQNMESIKETIRTEIEYRGTSVIISRRECIQTLNRKLKNRKK